MLDWDATKPSHLMQELQVVYMTPSNCHNHWHVKSDSYLCAWAGMRKPVDSSAGDSGGPLIKGPSNDGRKHVLVGVTSFGIADPRVNPGKPSVYSRVSNARDFIEENAQGVSFVTLPAASQSLLGSVSFLLLGLVLCFLALSIAAP